MESNIFTVSELNRYLKEKIEWDKQLFFIGIKGEISNFVHHSSGHQYFTLKDGASKLKCVFFKTKAQKLKFSLKNGLKVIAFGRIAVYERDGVYQLYPEKIEPDGIGSLHLAYLQLKEKLEKEGLFSSAGKKALPKIPQNIGVITSPTGAAVRDIINVLTRRFPGINILLIPAGVQGEGAAQSIVEALHVAENQNLDLLLLGRGGGSLEELWPFNEEIVVRAVAECSVPVISAVGHETDFTLVDFAADRRAPTPSAAAELAVPERRELEAYIQRLKEGICRTMQQKIKQKRTNLEMLCWNSVWDKPELLLAGYWQKLEERMNRLEALSPLRVLKRGYLLAEKAGKVITDLEEVNLGDKIRLHLQDGCLDCLVEKKEKKNEFDI